MFKPEYRFLLKEAAKCMIVGVMDIENYDTGKLMDGKIKYKVGDSWTDKANDGYKTLYAYYYYYYRDCDK
jgi:hypothetical protein